MRILIACSYYAPYVSGLTEYARLLAEGLAERGHAVTVAATRHRRDLARVETLNGVQVHRAPVLATAGRAPLSPGYAGLVRRLASRAGVVNLHLPMADALLVAGALGRTPLVVTYHCDVAPGGGLLGPPQAWGIDLASRVALRSAAKIAVSTLDYAKASRVLGGHLDRCVEIPPVAKRPLPAPGSHREAYPVIGFCGRIVEEKGLDHLLAAMPLVREAHPGARLLIAGEYRQVAGGSVIERLRPLLPEDGSVELLGSLSEEALWSFYRSLDVLVLPSVNSFEAFGMVQVEAMLAGVPVVASDLPGVREPVRRTGMGIVVPPRRSDAIARAVLDLLAAPGDYLRPAPEIDALFGRETALAAYERLFGDAAAGPTAGRHGPRRARSRNRARR